MIYTEQMLLTKYQGYKNAKMKVCSETNKGTYLRLKRGFYSDDSMEHPFRIANFLRAPSYVSFQSALSYYGLIPEGVFATTSAAVGMGKTKEWTNAFGLFTFRDIPSAVFGYGILDDPSGFQIASKEKAFADTLYILPVVHSLKELEELLWEDQRMDREECRKMNREDLRFLLPLYRSANTKLFLRWMDKNDGK